MMKKAAFYARVSSDLQRKERTIESQIDGLKKQIDTAGHILVKEYIDDGWSGSRLDRPALDELRQDLKKDVFDVIYFWSSDRIAREVTYQNIIISELIKSKKQIFIGGKDYEANPENKFTLQIFGAVDEFERAKIIERSMRGKQKKLREGVMMSAGGGTFGYDYICKTPTSPAKMTINEKEAKIVRFIYDEFTANKGGMHQLTRKLEDMGAINKRGGTLWRVAAVYKILRNHTYTGIKYFNRMQRITEYANPISGTKMTKKLLIRDKSEWVGIPVPPIIPKELFDSAQERLAWNKSRYRTPKLQQLLSLLIKCGHCGSTFCAYQRYYIRYTRSGEKKVHHHFAYRCSRRFWVVQHSRRSSIPRCESTERSSHILERQVFSLIEENLFDPGKLREYMDIFKTKRPHPRMEKELKKLEKSITMLTKQKQRITDLYAAEELERDAYVAKSRTYDNELLTLTNRKTEILRQLPLFRKTALVDMAIQEYCETAKLRYKHSVDFETKRQFLLDYVEKIVYQNDKIVLHGAVPVVIHPHGEKPETNKLAFQIPLKVSCTAGNKYLRGGKLTAVVE